VRGRQRGMGVGGVRGGRERRGTTAQPRGLCRCYFFCRVPVYAGSDPRLLRTRCVVWCGSDRGPAGPAPTAMLCALSLGLTFNCGGLWDLRSLPASPPATPAAVGPCLSGVPGAKYRSC
jgi:hypothetical protein